MSELLLCQEPARPGDTPIQTTAVVRPCQLPEPLSHLLVWVRRLAPQSASSGWLQTTQKPVLSWFHDVLRMVAGRTRTAAERPAAAVVSRGLRRSRQYGRPPGLRRRRRRALGRRDGRCGPGREPAVPASPPQQHGRGEALVHTVILALSTTPSHLARVLNGYINLTEMLAPGTTPVPALNPAIAVGCVTLVMCQHVEHAPAPT